METLLAKRRPVIIHRTEFTRFDEAIQLLAEHGFDGLADVFERSVTAHEVMKIERCEALGAVPYERRAYANGFKDKGPYPRWIFASGGSTDTAARD